LYQCLVAGGPICRSRLHLWRTRWLIAGLFRLCIAALRRRKLEGSGVPAEERHRSEPAMRPLPVLLGVVAVTVAAASAAQAQNYPWCANFHDGAGVNCGFATYQQCLATSQGSGGYCTRNNLYVPPAAAAPAAHRAPRNHRR
jgi:hypothetical protein